MGVRNLKVYMESEVAKADANSKFSCVNMFDRPLCMHAICY